jgi:hypothetical protein
MKREFGEAAQAVPEDLSSFTNPLNTGTEQIYICV